MGAYPSPAACPGRTGLVERQRMGDVGNKQTKPTGGHKVEADSQRLAYRHFVTKDAVLRRQSQCVIFAPINH